MCSTRNRIYHTCSRRKANCGVRCRFLLDNVRFYMTEAMLALLYVSKSFGSLVQFLVSHHKFRPLNFMLFFLCMYISRPFPDCSCSFAFSPLIFVFLSRPHSPPPFLLLEPLHLLLAPPLLQALFGSPCFALLLILLLKRLEIRE